MTDAPQGNSPIKRPDKLLDAAKDNTEYLIFHRNDPNGGEVGVN